MSKDPGHATEFSRIFSETKTEIDEEEVNVTAEERVWQCIIFIALARAFMRPYSALSSDNCTVSLEPDDLLPACSLLPQL